jgi:hypothetical protein
MTPPLGKRGITRSWRHLLKVGDTWEPGVAVHLTHARKVMLLDGGDIGYLREGDGKVRVISESSWRVWMLKYKCRVREGGVG